MGLLPVFLNKYWEKYSFSSLQNSVLCLGGGMSSINVQSAESEIIRQYQKEFANRSFASLRANVDVEILR